MDGGVLAFEGEEEGRGAYLSCDCNLILSRNKAHQDKASEAQLVIPKMNFARYGRECAHSSQTTFFLLSVYVLFAGRGHWSGRGSPSSLAGAAIQVVTKCMQLAPMKRLMSMKLSMKCKATTHTNYEEEYISCESIT
eukprot:gene2246-1406_t